MADAPSRRPDRPPFAALLAAVAIVSVACTDSVPVATTTDPPPTAAATPAHSPPTATRPTELQQPLPTLGPHGAGVVIGAEIVPNVATADQQVVVTPVAPVERTCGVAMALYDPYLWGDRELIGVLLDTGDWAPFDPNVTTTVLTCLPPPASDPISARIPDGLADGLYQACVGSIGSAEGCNLLRIVRPGEIAAGAADADAEPVAVAPGDGFTVTPTGDAAVCSRFELIVGVGGELELVGFPTADGDVQFDVPGATTTAPRCGADTGVRPGPITFVAPDVPAGTYLFCLASRFDPIGCARVTIDR